MHRHDYVVCECPNQTMVDGGRDYIRYGGKDMNLVHPSPVYLRDGFDVCRLAPIWGTYGKNRNSPFKWVSVSEMTTNHIHAIFKDQIKISDLMKYLLETELEYRKHNIYGTEPEELS